MFHRIASHWVYGGFVFALLLIPLGLVLLRHESVAVLLIFLHLPAYQIHQFEEHDRDRFRQYVNRVVGGGREILTTTAVFWINIGFVWALFTVLILLATTVAPGWGLGIVYGTLFNTVVHAVAAIRNREYHPGLITALVLFLPLSLPTLWMISHSPNTGWLQQTVGIILGVGIHAVIMAYLARRRRSLG